MNRLAPLALFLMWSVASSAIAQTPPPPQQPAPRPRELGPTPKQVGPPPPPLPAELDDVVRINTNLVQVDVVVTKDGKQVRDLQIDDFEIFEDGKRQEITSFSYVSNVPTTTTTSVLRPKEKGALKNAPPVPSTPLRAEQPRRTIALVVDDLGLSAESTSQVRGKLRKFINEQITPHDLIAIIRTAGQVGALQQFTNDKRLLESAVNQLKWNPCSRVGLYVFQPVESQMMRQLDPGRSSCGKYSVGNTMTSLSFILDAMSTLPGRKSMVVFTESMPREDQEELVATQNRPGPRMATTITRNYSAGLSKIAERAIRSSVVIYAIDTSGLQYTGPTAADNLQPTFGSINSQTNDIWRQRSQLLWNRREGAELIANQTGGRHIRNSNDFQLDRILEDQSGYYLLGYRPSDETFNRTFHKIKARVKKSGLQLRTRFGFYGVSDQEARRGTRSRLNQIDRTNLALMSPFGAQEIDNHLTSFFVQGNGNALIRSFLYLDATELTFAEGVDRAHTASIQVKNIVFSSNGIPAEQQVFDYSLKLTEKDYKQALREGITIQFDTPVSRPGTYQFRVAARDLKSSRIGSAGQFVEIPDLKNRRLALSGVVMQGLEEFGPADQTEQTVSNSLAMRRYQAGVGFRFICVVYNATLDPTKRQPNVVMQLRLFRDGKVIYTSPDMIVDLSNQPDPHRLIARGKVELSNDLEPGTYFLQVVAIDTLRKDKHQQVVQWIDFEVTK